MSLSDKLAAKVQKARAIREEQAQQPEPFRPNWGLAAAAFAGVTLVIAAHMPPVPDPVVTAPTPAPVVAPVVVAPAVSAEPQRCVPYASNGTYLPELCGERDPFTEKWDRIEADFRAERAEREGR